jgi:hypothetical protein
VTTYKEGKISVEVKGTNPSLVNGKVVQKGEKFTMQDGDVVTLLANGSYSFIMRTLQNDELKGKVKPKPVVKREREPEISTEIPRTKEKNSLTESLLFSFDVHLIA